MAIISFEHVQEELDRKRHELKTIQTGIGQDEEELSMREDIRKNYPQMLDEYEKRSRELEGILAHEKKLLDSLHMVREPFQDMKDSVAKEKAEATAEVRATEEKNQRALEEAQRSLEVFDSLTHEGEDPEEVRRKREGLEYVLGLRRQAYDTAVAERKAAEEKFDAGQKPVYDNISAVQHNMDKHQQAYQDAEVEYEDIALKRAYVNDCISDHTGDDELHDVIRRKRERCEEIQGQIAKLEKQKRNIVAVNRVICVLLVVCIALVVYGLVQAFA